MHCYATDDSNIPSVTNVSSASDVALHFQYCIEVGFYVHLLGILGDSSFAARIYVKKSQWFRVASLITVSLYSLLWLAWLIWLHVVVFTHGGKVCSGHYLDDAYTDDVD